VARQAARLASLRLTAEIRRRNKHKLPGSRDARKGSMHHHHHGHACVEPDRTDSLPRWGQRRELFRHCLLRNLLSFPRDVQLSHTYVLAVIYVFRSGGSTLGPGGTGPQIVARPPNLAVLLTHCGQSILRKNSKFHTTRCQILRVKCTKFDFRRGSAPDPAGGAELQRSPDP